MASKKSKILAMALCASVMTGIYVAPVMAAELPIKVGSKLTGVDGPGVSNGEFTISGGTLNLDGADIAKALNDALPNGTELNLGNGRLTVGNIKTNGSVTANAGFTANGGSYYAIRGTNNQYTMLANEKYFALGSGGLLKGPEDSDNYNTTKERATFYVDNATGDVTTKGTLKVTGATTVGSLEVTGGNFTVDADGNTTVGGTLNVTGATTVDSLTVKGAATVDSLEFKEDIKSANGAVEITKDGNMTLAGHATISSGATIQNGLSVTGGASVNGDFAVTNGGLSVSGGESVLNGGLTVNNGDTKLNGKLDVGAGNFKVDTNGNTRFNGNLNINHGNFTVKAATGNTVVKGTLKLGSLGDREVGQAIKDLEVYADELKGAKLPDKVGGIERNPESAGAASGDGTTTIENGAEFTETAMTMGDTIVESGKITVGAEGAQTIIEGGAITAKSLLLDGKDVGETIFGIVRDPENEVTTIEGVTSFDANGMSIKDADFGTSLGVAGMDITAAGGLKTSFTAGGATFVGAEGTTTINGGAIVTTTINGVNFSEWNEKVDNRLDDLEYKTQNIKPGTGAGTGTGAGGASGLTGGEDTITITVPDTAPGHTGITGDVTVGGEINAGEIVVGDKGSDNKTTINGGNITTGDTTIDAEGINTGNGDFSGEVNVGGNTNITGDGITTGSGNFTGNVDVDGKVTVGDGTTITGTGITTGNGNFTGNVDVDGKVTVGDGTTITGEGITTGTGTFDDVIIGENTTIDSNGINTNDITAVTGTIGNVEMNNTGIIVGGGTAITEDTVTTENIKADDGEFDSQVTVGGNTTITDGNINLGGDNGTNINADGMIVANANGANTNVSAGDVVITDKDGKDIALSDVGYVENIDRELQANGNYDGTVVGGINAEADIRRAEVNRLDNRISKVEDRVDKVGAMAAAIANLRTMGYDPAAPTEVAVGIGQYRDETGAALGLFHYPNRDFMLSLSVSTSGDEVMGGIGATWKFGRKSPEKVLAAEKEKAAKAKLAKAEAMKKAAKEAKIKAQQERHAKLAAERAAQAEAAK